MTTDRNIDGWLLQEASGGNRSASHVDGTAFVFTRTLGLTATTTQVTLLPPRLLLWLISPLLQGHIRTDDLEELQEKLGWV